MKQVAALVSTYSSDEFGICSALYELGGMVVMHDASGCNSTYTTHDEPRWYDMDSMIYISAISEMEAILHIFDELKGSEGILVASKIADRVGITRSVIVNALRKFESAGVIESRSSGMRGTYIKVLNDAVFDGIKKIREEDENLQ